MQYRYVAFGERVLSRIEPRAATITCASAARGLPPTPRLASNPRLFAAFFAFFASSLPLAAFVVAAPSHPRTLALPLRSHRRLIRSLALSPPLPPSPSSSSLFLSLSHRAGRTDVTVLRLTAATFLQLKQQQDQKENLLCSRLFETFSDDHRHAG